MPNELNESFFDWVLNDEVDFVRFASRSEMEITYKDKSRNYIQHTPHGWRFVERANGCPADVAARDSL